jgi:hypothetical protein
LSVDLLPDDSEALAKELTSTMRNIRGTLKRVSTDKTEVQAIVDEMVIQANKAKYLSRLA